MSKRDKLEGALEALDEVRHVLPVNWGSRADAIRDKYRAQLAALGPEPEAETGAYRLFVWTDHCTFAAVAHAKTVAQARELIEAEDLGGHDGSCPERVAARKMIYGETPGIYRGGQAVLMFDTGKPEPEQSWTPRERRLREAVETLNHAAKVAIYTNYGASFEEGAPLTIRLLDGTCDATDEVLAAPPPPDPRDEALERAEAKAWSVVMFLDGVHRHKLIENYSPDYTRLQEARTDAADLLAAIRAARGTK